MCLGRALAVAPRAAACSSLPSAAACPLVACCAALRCCLPPPACSLRAASPRAAACRCLPASARARAGLRRAALLPLVQVPSPSSRARCLRRWQVPSSLSSLPPRRNRFPRRFARLEKCQDAFPIFCLCLWDLIRSSLCYGLTRSFQAQFDANAASERGSRANDRTRTNKTQFDVYAASEQG